MNKIRIVTFLALFFAFNAGKTCSLTTSLISTNPVSPCSYSCNGVAIIMVSGGTAPYTATGPMTPSSVSFSGVGTLTGMCEGMNTITITDMVGCTTTMTINIGGPSPIVFTTSTSSASAACDGSITVTATGGTGSLTYSKDGGTTYQASNVFNSLCAGAYNICVMDANGCVSCSSVTVFSSCTMVSTSGGITNVSCHGVCNGSVIIASTMGTMPYTVTVAGSTYTYMGSVNVNGLCAGTYTVTTTDAAGCTYPVTFTITEPAALNLAATTSDESSSGACDGGITASASGGTAPYTYNVDGGVSGSTSSFTGLCAGAHTVCVTDANGCMACSTVIVGTASCTFAATAFSPTGTSCYGTCDGTCMVAASGGTAPYVASVGSSTVSFTSTGSLSGLCGGTNVINFIDAMGCTGSYTILIPSPSAIVPNVSFTPESTPGACDGTITSAATGGTTPYTYTLDGISCPASPSGVCGGWHVFCVTDINGCSSCDSLFLNTSSCTATNVVTVINNLCYGDCNGVMMVNTTGGTAPYVVTVDSMSATYSGTGTLASLCAGTYTGTVTDAGGCMYPITFNITQPTALSVSASVTNPTSGCNGVINASAAGGTSGYVYSTDGGITWQASGTFSGLCADVYNLCAQDANGCITCTPVTLAASGCSMVTTVVPTSVTCFGACDATAMTTATGGTAPYTVTVGSTTLTYTTSATFTGLCAGTYVANTIDATGCTGIYTFIVTGPSDIVTTATGTNPTTVGGCDGSIAATTSGGTPGYTYAWYNCTTGVFLAGNTANQTGLCAGQYAYIVTDASGCSDSITCVTLSNPTGITEKINGNAFSIYPNPTNGMLTVAIDADGNNHTMILTDVLGQVVTSSEIKSKTTLDLNAMGLNNGIYFVTITGKSKAKHTQKIVLSR